MTLDVRRFVKICGLMSSSNAAERASAAQQASKVLSAAGLNWEDVLIGATPRRRATNPSGKPTTHSTKKDGMSATDLLNRVNERGEFQSGDDQRFVQMQLRKADYGDVRLNRRQWERLEAIARSAGIFA
jgi:hypothetical protein